MYERQGVKYFCRRRVSRRQDRKREELTPKTRKSPYLFANGSEMREDKMTREEFRVEVHTTCEPASRLVHVKERWLLICV